MIHTKEQIIEKAIQVMNTIDWGYNRNEGIRIIFESMEEAIEDDRKYVKDEKLLEFAIENAKPDHWIVFFEFEPEAELDNNSIHLSICDDNGEPFQIRHKQAFFVIKKGEDGKYFTEFLRNR